jgi:2-polyprenyl-6-methoxyphenol hydroxylase-like FAD-dependent oxidoreductase
MRTRIAVIAGGGIGGLTAAIALIARGWQVEVLEQESTGNGGAGSGISLWPNALRALAAVGLRDTVRDLGRLEITGGIRDQGGRWLIRTSLAEVERRYGPLVVLHRADLMSVLAGALPPGTVRPGVRVRGIGTGGTGAAGGTRAVVRHSAGETAADLVIGADGVHSTVRGLLWPDAGEPRYAGYTAWRLITGPAGPLAEGSESWGAGERFGIVPLRDGRTYCFATANVPAGRHGGGSELAELRRRFGSWHDPIPGLLDHADGAAVLRNDILEAPALASYVAAGRVALLGDAAHAMTPNLGQGACQAMEDAVVLASVLDETADIAAALARYDRIRRPRTQAVVRQSRRAGRLAQWSWAPAVAARGLMMRMTPGSALLNGLRPILGWTWPGEVSPGH